VARLDVRERDRRDHLRHALPRAMSEGGPP
jgi:hypothetical protein